MSVETSAFLDEILRILKKGIEGTFVQTLTKPSFGVTSADVPKICLDIS